MNENCIWPPLPESANYYLREEKLASYSNAMADVLCWLDGFMAAGGKYSPQTHEVLRDLSSGLKSILEQTPTNDSAHTKRKPK